MMAPNKATKSFSIKDKRNHLIGSLYYEQMGHFVDYVNNAECYQTEHSICSFFNTKGFEPQIFRLIVGDAEPDHVTFTSSA